MYTCIQQYQVILIISHNLHLLILLLLLLLLEGQLIINNNITNWTLYHNENEPKHHIYHIASSDRRGWDIGDIGWEKG